MSCFDYTWNRMKHDNYRFYAARAGGKGRMIQEGEYIGKGGVYNYVGDQLLQVTNKVTVQQSLRIAKELHSFIIQTAARVAAVGVRARATKKLNAVIKVSVR